jgi:hypothetical protein
MLAATFSISVSLAAVFATVFLPETCLLTGAFGGFVVDF